MGEELKKKLLHQRNNSLVSDVGEEESLGKRAWEESKKMWVVAGPAIFTRFSTFGITVVTQSFIGHIGSTELAAYALVITVLVRFANGVLIGMASALETLCGQAYGAKRYDMLGVYLQRSWIVLFMTSILLLPIYIFTTPLLEALGQEKSIAQVAGSISLWAIGVIFSFSVSFTCQMFLQAQSKNKIIAYLAAVSISIHVLLSWLLTVKFKFGLNGAMTSTLLAYWIPNLGQLLYIMKKCPDTWKGFTFLAFKDLCPVIKLSVSSGAMLCLEIWYNTVLILLTGNMKNAEVSIDALAICLNINGWEMMVALGFFAAAGVRVANELGRGSAKAAKFSILISVITSFFIGFILFLVFLFLREKLAYIFTTNPHVAEAVGDLSPLLSISILLNSVQPVLSGVSVGAGWQSVVAYVNIGCYYLIGIPVGLMLDKLLHLQVKGIWIGMLFGTFVQTVMLITITFKTDWDKQVEIARNRVNKWAVVENQESNNRSSGSS
ncbi:protein DETOXIFICATION 21 [Cajanus cajan]|uniref:Protein DETOXIFICATION n=1 Tax=Cajanus cajan TaxID=3821 RepID=A0A151TAB9_CAJCA|nr:protein DETOXIFICATION 21 [Cajanus cajan]KYP64002.1 Protein TRANSPARENT TESTA 12 [Cajanus cajan]